MHGLAASFGGKLTTYSLDFCAFSRYTEEKGGNGVRIDKGVIKKLFVLIACCILFGWLVLDTARATALFSAIWNLISPFVVGAGIAIEKGFQGGGDLLRQQGLRIESLARIAAMSDDSLTFC